MTVHAEQGAPQSTGEPATRRIVRPQRVPIREVWPTEATHFTPWLADNLDFLDELGLGRLDLLKVEAPIPGLWRCLDILAQTANGRRVAIENQYRAADHDHLTRGLAYAVGHDARALVVIAEQHHPEFIAVADYLNRCKEAFGDEKGIAVFLVTVSVEQIGNAYVPRFAVLSRPNTWREEVATSGAGRLSGDDEFLSACDEATRPVAEEILRNWRSLYGSSVQYGKANASLNLRNAAKGSSGSTSVFALYTNGQLWLNRGYLIDGRMAPEAEIDVQIQRWFPDARWGEKRYYLYVPTAGQADAQGTDALGRWLVHQTTGPAVPGATPSADGDSLALPE
ncbi:MAG TPA: hypothetical protein VFC00_14620 [Micromonosporaceae bacterium]|nr:hypothetical protein [Micromonosporaceae bacterium]